jgi:hypothetical protein
VEWGNTLKLESVPPAPTLPKETHTHTHTPNRHEIENKYRVKIKNKIIIFPGCIPDHPVAALVDTKWCQ